MKKLVLIIPPSPWMISDRDQLCLGPLYISSFLKHRGFEVQVVDLASLPEEYWYFPVGDVYGVTGVSPQYVYMKKIIDRLKEREPHKLVIVGGVHATVMPEHILDTTDADACVLDEGEYPMLEVMMGTPLEEIKSLFSRSYGCILNKPIEELDTIPFPDRDSCDYFTYLTPGIHKFVANTKREGKLITGRGCPYRCAFCASNRMHQTVRYRSPSDVVLEVKHLKERYGVEILNIIDDTFMLNKSRVEEICRLIRPLDMKWYCLTRPDCADPYLLNIMSRSGCKSITFGFESGSNRILKKIRKNTTVEQAYTAIENVKKAGMKIRGQMMVGLPTETMDDVEMTADFIRTAKEVDVFSIHVFQPYPGCDIWDYPEKYGIEIDKDTDFSDWHTCGKVGATLSKNEAIQWSCDYLRKVAAERNLEAYA